MKVIGAHFLLSQRFAFLVLGQENVKGRSRRKAKRRRKRGRRRQVVQALKGSIKTSALGSVADPDPLNLAGYGFTSIRAPDPDPLRFLFPDLDSLKGTWK